MFDFCRILCYLVNVDVGVIFWMGENGFFVGFFYEDFDVVVCDFFVNVYEELFIGDWEVNVVLLII